MPGFVTPHGPHHSVPIVSILVPAKIGARTLLAESEYTTITSITQITSGELEFVHPTGQWGAFDLDSGLIP